MGITAAYIVVAAVMYEEGVVKPKREATTLAEKQERKNEEMLTNAKEQERKLDLDLERDKQRAERKQKTSNTGKASTILTSPLGIPASGSSSNGKTILGG